MVITISLLSSAGFDKLLAFTHYGNEFRILRRQITQYFNSKNSESLYPLLADQVKIILKNLLYEPEKFEEHFDRF